MQILKHKRKEKKLSQEDVSRELGVEESTYRKIENGSRSLQLPYYDTISETLDIPRIQLLLSAMGKAGSDRASLKYLLEQECEMEVTDEDIYDTIEFLRKRRRK